MTLHPVQITPLIRALVAVHKHGSQTKAKKATGMKRRDIRKRVRLLEEAMGEKLVTYERGKRWKLTDVGRILATGDYR